tara:strand:+ start:191 stop:373 length:183 start_codon:yes stop_codon:yes gene_type:complete
MNTYPVRGLVMIILTILISIALLIYIGAEFSEYRISERINDSQNVDVWWERGFISVCPLH